MRVEPYTKSEQWIRCPSCGKGEWRIGHMFAIAAKGLTRQFGPWYCDRCGSGWEGRTLTDGGVELEESCSQLAKLEVTLDIEGPVRVLLSDTLPMTDDEDSSHEQMSYLYEQHLSPDDVFRRVEELVSGQIRFVSVDIERKIRPVV